MNRADRVLYHQIHPAKLFTDVAAATAAAAVLWHHRMWLAFAIGFLPSIAVSAAILRYSNLAPYRDSAFGHYIARFMTRRVELARLAGLIPLWGGAWLRRPIVIAFGFVWILGCWALGTINPRTTRS